MSALGARLAQAAHMELMVLKVQLATLLVLVQVQLVQTQTMAQAIMARAVAARSVATMAEKLFNRLLAIMVATAILLALQVAVAAVARRRLAVTP
jgi:cation transporter-like permease